MSDTRERILEWLADGDEHSGADLAARLGITRAGVGRHIGKLRVQGWRIAGRVGGGYRLDGPARPLRPGVIRSALGDVAGRITELEVLREIGSTSDHLAGQELPSDGRIRVCMADRQTAGRGRRGRSWLDQPGGGIALSLGRWVPVGPAELTPLGLVVALAVADALERTCGLKIGLKWPNDIQIEEAKVGGILIDLAGESAGPSRVVAGIGLNHHFAHLPPELGDRSVTDLARHCPDLPARERIAAAVLRAVLVDWDRLQEHGFGDFRTRWMDRDCLAGRPVRVETAPGAGLTGMARGIDGDGALRVETAAGVQRFFSGDVSVRPER